MNNILQVHMLHVHVHASTKSIVYIAYHTCTCIVHAHAYYNTWTCTVLAAIPVLGWLGLSRK